MNGFNEMRSCLKTSCSFLWHKLNAKFISFSLHNIAYWHVRFLNDSINSIHLMRDIHEINGSKVAIALDVVYTWMGLGRTILLICRMRCDVWIIDLGQWAIYVAHAEYDGILENYNTNDLSSILIWA